MITCRLTRAITILRCCCLLFFWFSFLCCI